MRQLAGTKTKYRRAHATPLTRLISGREFLRRVHQEFRSPTFATLANKISIDYASLGGDAGFIGAAGCARRAVDPGRVSLWTD